MKVLILGANSYVGYALARKFAQEEKADLYLASRDLELLAKKVQDLEVRYQVKAVPLFFEARDYASHGAFYEQLDPKPDGVVAAFGYLGEQVRAQADFQEARQILEINLVGAVSILEIVAADFARRRRGFIIGISSVAGERGRQSNYIYGAAKGGLLVYLSGLRNRLAQDQVRVITVLPGFVKTKMTEHLDLPEVLSAEPEEAAEDIYRAYVKGKEVVYSKGLWKWIMRAIKVIPEGLFKRLRL
jgi:short-subunit dehydrogenase